MIFTIVGTWQELADILSPLSNSKLEQIHVAVVDIQSKVEEVKQMSLSASAVTTETGKQLAAKVDQLIAAETGAAEREKAILAILKANPLDAEVMSQIARIEGVTTKLDATDVVQEQTGP
jgi:hypothetical protein